MSTVSSAGSYVLGHSDEELERLARQADLFEDDTRAWLSAAGIKPGMRVLDIGCGAGDVAIIAAELVGPTGSILAIDKAQSALDVASRRAQAAGLNWIRFDCQDINHLAPSERFDAIIGRFVLLHFADPKSVIVALQKFLVDDGVMAFAEMDIRSTSVTPALPLMETCVGWIVSLYEKSGLDPNTGSKLYQIFRRAGLTPSLRATCRIEAGTSVPGLNYLVATVRSMQPVLFALGITTEKELDIDTLAERLATAVAGGDHCVIFPRLIGAWARPSPI